ncbi:MAG TPA: TIGR02679 family protein, partial [Gammaproteobacteria bacterium]|nr:TIGR02679 family protein [Gammaproteobacteria bacterium]
RLLGGAELAPLRGRLRARYERGKADGVFTLTALNAAERAALERLLGKGARGAGSMRLSVAELDAAVARAGLARDFRAALEQLDGPLVDRKAERFARTAAWSEVLACVSDSRLRAVVTRVQGAALVKRLARGDHALGRELLDRAQRVLARLPADGTPLAQLAAETLGDAHALDAAQPVATVVLRALGADALEESSAAEAEALGMLPRDRRREQWARAGVTVNELGAPALCLNLCASGDTVAADLVARGARSGEPLHLSLRVLLRSVPRWDVAGRTVYVCENPSIVAVAADRLGVRAAPLVCTDGMPGAAQQILLRQLVHAGARLLYHGDFDWPGIAIGNFVARAFGALPWRFSAADYRAASFAAGLPLSGRSVTAAWDAELAGAMLERGAAVHEEAVVESLCLDLEFVA